MTQSTAPLTGAPSTGALNAEEIAAIRADFPYLERAARNGEALAYLDWAATSQKPAGVIATEADFYRMSNGAAGRSTYQLADEATATFEDARDAVAAFVGARADGTRQNRQDNAGGAGQSRQCCAPPATASPDHHHSLPHSCCCPP